jgi:glyoxylase-like metal-dependent hydrolase (beta-lactamase superfamily II)
MRGARWRSCWTKSELGRCRSTAIWSSIPKDCSSSTPGTARNSLRNYLPRTNPFFQYMVQIGVAPEEEIGPRLTAMGIDIARDVRQLVMTHLHHDHTGGLHHFPHTEILFAEDGLRGASAGSLAQCRGRGRGGSIPGRSSSTRRAEQTTS